MPLQEGQRWNSSSSCRGSSSLEEKVLGAAPKAKAAPDSLKKLRSGDRNFSVDMSSSAEARAKKSSTEVIDVDVEGATSSSANPPKAKPMPKPSSAPKAAASSSAAPGRVVVLRSVHLRQPIRCLAQP